MAAPRGTFVAPRHSLIAGQVFTAPSSSTAGYNAYLQANARALGFRNYSEQKAVRKSAGTLFSQEQRAGRFGRPGQLPPAERTRLTQILGQFRGQNLRDKSVGGPLDRYLQALGRRTGKETFPVGETPRA